MLYKNFEVYFKCKKDALLNSLQESIVKKEYANDNLI